MPGYAFFDLDGTLLPGDTQMLFAQQVIRREPRRRWHLALVAFGLPLVPLVGARGLKRLYFSFLWKLPAHRIWDLVDEFVEELIPRHCFAEMLREIDRHRYEGRTLILNTASPGLYAEAIARKLEFDECVSTPMRLRDPMPLLPEIEGPNNKRAAKLPPMKAFLPTGFDPADPQALPDSWAYTDSANDLPLLRCAENRVVVHPSEKLAALAEAEGWEIKRPDFPSGYQEGKLARVEQMLGLS
ncbi:MAG: HAD-IB family phosphatase [Verrucomicrobiota bacterium]